MDEKEVAEVYKDAMKTEKDAFPALATVKTLITFMNRDKSNTLKEFNEKIKVVFDTLKCIEPFTEVESTMEIFYRYTTLRASEFETVEESKADFKRRGNKFLEKVLGCKQTIANYGHPFISDGSVVLVNAKSRIVYATLVAAHKSNKRFTVYVTESCPDKSGKEMCKWLTEAGISSELILDVAIGVHMEKVDIVLVGAEGVVENGGIINKTGTYPLALCAKALNKPFYVLAESYKFVRLYPLNQADIPDRIKYKNSEQSKTALVDYTPPSFITLLLTDLGILTTAAVSDVLMYLYL